MMITIPLYIPIVNALCFDPVWFTVIYLLNMEMAVTTLPFGVALFVIKGVAPPDTTMIDIYKAGLPFLGCDVISMALIMAFPSLSTLAASPDAVTSGGTMDIAMSNQ